MNPFSASSTMPTELPSLIALADCPQLASVSLMQAALRVVSTSLDLYHPSLGSLQDAARDAHAWPPSLLAHLIVNRCRELGDLAAAYRAALLSPGGSFAHDDDSPF